MHRPLSALAVALVTSDGCGHSEAFTGGVQVTTEAYPAPGNPAGGCAIPPEAAAEDTSAPTTVVGTGTPASCTPAAFEAAVQRAGVVTFDCGPDPVTIVLPHEIRLLNDAGPDGLGDRVIDGGGKITLSGYGRSRILYQDGCDPALHWITDHCQSYEHPRLVLQNLVFADGASADPERGGGAVYARSGQLKIVNSVFVRSRIASVGPDVAGAAVYALQQAGPVYVVNSTFGGGAAFGNVGSNGGALGSIGVSWTVLNSTMTHNQAVGVGMNPAQPGTPGGGSGGAIYNDGNTYTLTICGSEVANGAARELAGAVFFVSNDLTGHVVLDRSSFHDNASGVNAQPEHPGFFVLAASMAVTGTTIR
jgi:hypothetical protein